MPTSRHPSFVARASHPSAQTPEPMCCWCHHDVRGDLRPAYTSWGVLVTECVDTLLCDLRSALRGLELGLHMEDL